MKSLPLKAAEPMDTENVQLIYAKLEHLTELLEERAVCKDTRRAKRESAHE